MIEVTGGDIVGQRTSAQGSVATFFNIPGVVAIEPKIFGDARGFFLESYQRERYREFGIEAEFVQDNMSFSGHGVLRGLHYQNPLAQAKLVTVIIGEVFDVAVDIRRGSPTFGRWIGMRLNAENRCQFYVPRGFAHGFCVLSETALFAYKCDEAYAPSHEHAIRYDDPELNITWPHLTPILSAKDAGARILKEFPAEHLPSFSG